MKLKWDKSWLLHHILFYDFRIDYQLIIRQAIYIGNLSPRFNQNKVLLEARHSIFMVDWNEPHFTWCLGMQFTQGIEARDCLRLLIELEQVQATGL